MLTSFFLFVSSLYVFFSSSLHSLFVLLFFEVLVLLLINIIFLNFFSWYSVLIFLVVVVSVGAYGISILVDIVRSKGGNYFFSF